MTLAAASSRPPSFDAALFGRVACQVLQKLYSGNTQGLRIRHHMYLRNHDGVVGIEHAADLNHVFHGPFSRRSILARQHRLFVIRQLHIEIPQRENS